jgi:hypothetical protein
MDRPRASMAGDSATDPQGSDRTGPSVRGAGHLLLAFDDEREQPMASALAAALGWPLRYVQRHAFPDGETRLTLPALLPPQVVFLRGLRTPMPN